MNYDNLEIVEILHLNDKIRHNLILIVIEYRGRFRVLVFVLPVRPTVQCAGIDGVTYR